MTDPVWTPDRAWTEVEPYMAEGLSLLVAQTEAYRAALDGKPWIEQWLARETEFLRDRFIEGAWEHRCGYMRNPPTSLAVFLDEGRQELADAWAYGMLLAYYRDRGVTL